MLSPMRRASTIAVLTALLLVTACGSGGDDEGADDGGRPDSSNSAGSDPTGATDGESDASSDASPTESTESTEPTEPSGSTEPSEPSEPPPANHNPAKPTVATKKRVPSDTCSLLTAQDLKAAGFGSVKDSQPMPDGGCAAEAASGRFEGLVYGVPPKEPGGKVPSGPMKIKAYGLGGNTAFWGCYAEAGTCTAAVAIGADRWAAVHVASSNLASQRTETVNTAKKLLQRLFDRLPNA